MDFAEIFTEMFKTSPAIALAALLSYLFYKVSMRALDALEKNTEALSILRALITEDRRKEARNDN